MSDRVGAGLLLVGVAALTAAWVLGGLVTPGFDPVRDSISQLQREGAATSATLTAAFCVFAVGVLAFTPSLPAPPRVAAVLVAAATLGAAASPLGELRGGTQDAVHLGFGATGYVSLSVLPLLTAPFLRGRARATALLAGAVTSACLLGTVPADAVSGALQRGGFLVVHLWLASRAVQVLRGGTLSGMQGDELDAHLDAVLIGGRRPVLVELAEPDPAWPQRFVAHRDRIVGALGDLARDVEHVGSTSVPGLAAKPVIDVQLVVPSLEREREWLPALEAAGYVLRVREPGHRMVKAVPPLDDANVHLYGPGDPEPARVLRFRDLLRADPAARQRYEDVKRSLAGRVWPDMNHYATAKTAVILELLDEPAGR